MRNRNFALFALFFVWFASSGQMCTKVMVYGKDYQTSPKKGYYPSDVDTVAKSTQKALQNMGYEIIQGAIDDSTASYDSLMSSTGATPEPTSTEHHFVTGWKAVGVDSHYFNFFDRKDYGASDGAYYQLFVDVLPEGGKTKVLVYTKVKTIGAKLTSSGKIESKLITQLDDNLRSPQIEMTNVDVKNK